MNKGFWISVSLLVLLAGGLYTVVSKTYYSDANPMNIGQIDEMRNTFNMQFSQCQSIVNDKFVEALYQDCQ